MCELYYYQASSEEGFYCIKRHVMDGEVKEVYACKLCRKGKLVKCKETLHFGTVSILSQPLYICDTCDVAFQKVEDYRHMEHLCSIAHV